MKQVGGMSLSQWNIHNEGAPFAGNRFFSSAESDGPNHDDTIQVGHVYLQIKLPSSSSSRLSY
eukprot:scaffold21423_cov84-Skeletonema_dohrnii-CCMP3373.AAC.1